MSDPTGIRPTGDESSELSDKHSAHFDTSHLNKNLNARIAKSGAVTLAAQATKFVLRLGSVSILARLLKPEDFGLIGLVTVLTGYIEMFKDAGLSMATVQAKKLNQDQVSALFWINVGFSVVIMLIKLCLAPAIAWFYDEPRLVSVAMCLACLTVFGGMSVQHQALLRRKMQFTRIAVIDIVSMLAGILTAVGMALKGYGYWSLVGMTAANTISTTILSFALSGWIPGRPAKASGVGNMVKFGGNLVGANMFNYLTRNADNFVVGYMHGTAALGIYTRAYSLFQMPLQQFLAPISAVVIPALSRVKDEPVRFRAVVLEKSYFVVFFVALVTGYSFTTAPEIVRICLGPTWAEASTIVRFLAFGGAIYGTNVAGSWVSTIQGWSHRQLRVAMICGPLYTLSFFVGGVYGPVGVACAFSITCTLLRYPVFRYLLKGSVISPRDLMQPLAKVGSAVAVAVVAALLAAYLLSTENFILSLAVKTLVFTGITGLLLAASLLKLPKITRKG